MSRRHSPAQPTPGPWHTSEEFQPGKYGLRSVISVYTEGMVLAHVNCGWGDIAVDNARLIAAAPELLEALQDLVMLAVQHRGQAVADSVRRAREAIAKATGVAPYTVHEATSSAPQTPASTEDDSKTLLRENLP